MNEKFKSPESILAHLAPLLTSQIENVATDAFAHLLLQYPFLGSAFQEYLLSAGIALPDQLTYKTQARWQDTAIPDLVGLDSEGRYRLIVESKFWASLTTNQPETYLMRLPPDLASMLLFIAPVSLRTTLWGELIARCADLLAHSPDQPQIETDQFLTKALNETHLLALTSWESLLEFLRKQAVKVKDEYAAGDIWQLQSLCARVDADAFKPISDDEITSPSKMRIAQFRYLINDLVTHLEADGVVAL